MCGLQPDSHPLKFKAAKLLIALSTALTDVLPLRMSQRERGAWLAASVGAHRLLQDHRGEARALGQLAALHIENDDIDAALKCYERLQRLRAAHGAHLARDASHTAPAEPLRAAALIAQAITSIGARRTVEFHPVAEADPLATRS